MRLRWLRASCLRQKADFHSIQAWRGSREISPPLLMLYFPIVIDGRIVIRDPAFVLRIVEAIGHIYQQRIFVSDHFIPVSHTGRNENLPWTKITGVNGIARAKGGRFRT